MSPLLRAQQWYERYVPHGNFGAELADFLVGADNALISRPDIFLMAEQVRWDNEQRCIVAGEPNAWYVRLAATNRGISPVMDAAPWPHEWVLWQRRNDGHFRARRWETLAAKTERK